MSILTAGLILKGNDSDYSDSNLQAPQTQQTLCPEALMCFYHPVQYQLSNPFHSFKQSLLHKLQKIHPFWMCFLLLLHTLF